MRPSSFLPRALLAALLAARVLLPDAIGSAAQAPGFAEISSPAAGDSLAGMVTISGSANHPAFVAYDLSFGYANDGTGTWFPIAESVTNPVTDGPLALWDTRPLSDEAYVLRLHVRLEDGSVLEAIVGDVQVRNYTPTRTPRADRTAAPLATATLPSPPQPTAELGTPPPGPPNAERVVLTALRMGMAVGVLGLAVVGLLVLGRRAWRWGQASIPRRRPRRRRRRRTPRP